MIWPFKNRAKPMIEDVTFIRMVNLTQPPITRAEQAAATHRLDPDNWPFRMIDWGDGPTKFYTGMIDGKDYSRRDGYLICVEGRDRFGWPKGHPDSPATPAVSQAQSGHEAAEPRSLLKNPTPERETG